MLKVHDRVVVIADRLSKKAQIQPFIGAAGEIVTIYPSGPFRYKVSFDTLRLDGRGAAYYFDRDELQLISSKTKNTSPGQSRK